MKVTVFVTKYQLGHELLNYLNWVLFFTNLFQFGHFC